MKLKDIANVSIGLVVSRKKEKNASQQYKILDLRCINKEGTIEKEKVKKFRSSAELSKYSVKEGDLIVRLTPPFDIIRISNIEKKFILSQYFCKIEVKSDNILPSYLAWYMNSTYGNKFFKMIGYGTTIRRLPLGKLKEMEILEIPIKAQKEIAQLNNLVIEEYREIELFKEKRKLQVKGHCHNIVESYIGGEANER